MRKLAVAMVARYDGTSKAAARGRAAAFIGKSSSASQEHPHYQAGQRRRGPPA